MTEISPIANGLRSIHKIISRGLSVSIQKCDEYSRQPGMTSMEAEGLSMYAATLRWVMHSHHLTEDEVVFPFFRDKIDAPFARLGSDHRTMSVILTNLEKCLPEISSGGVARLRSLLGEIDILWGPHIMTEEECFTMEKLNEVVGIGEQAALAGKFAVHSRTNSGPPPLALPFMFYNLEGKNREDFLMLFPWIVKKFLVPVAWRGKWKPMRPFLLV